MLNDDARICPCNPNHIVAKHRIQSHLLEKCKSWRKGMDLKYCVADTTVIFLPENEKYHLQNCFQCNRKKLDESQTLEEKKKIGKKKLEDESIKLDLNSTQMSTENFGGIITSTNNNRYQETIEQSFLEEAELIISETEVHKQLSQSQSENKTILY